MIGLAGARVLVVDDKVGEALPVLNAFAKVGIPTVFFDGKLSKLPRKKDRLIGVRLAVLDMDLGEGGGPENIVSTLVKRIERILDPSNGPYAVLIWTNHSDWLDLFEHYMSEANNVPKPICTTMITKAACKNLKGDINLGIVAKKLNEALQQVGPLKLIQAWEGLSFVASTGVSNSLSKVVGEAAHDLSAWRKEWKVQTMKVLRTLAKANAGKQLDENNLMESIFAVLGPLQADGIEKEIPFFRSLVGDHATEIMGVQGDCSSDRKAEVNSMLHLAFRELKGFSPGHIHVYKTKTGLGWPVNFSEFLADFVKQDGTPDQVTNRISEAFRASHPFIVEINPVCDFSQDKHLVNRFLCGLLVSVDNEKNIKKTANFIKKIGPIIFKSRYVPKGKYNLYFSSRLVLSFPVSGVKQLRIDVRLRAQALSDLQSWFSHQAGRPGVVLLR